MGYLFCTLGKSAISRLHAEDYFVPGAVGARLNGRWQHQFKCRGRASRWVKIYTREIFQASSGFWCWLLLNNCSIRRPFDPLYEPEIKNLRFSLPHVEEFSPPGD